MDYVQERYNPQDVPVNSTITVTGASLGGFLCKTSGTISLVKASASGSTIFSGIPVTAGIYTPLPFHIGKDGAYFTTAGGASGTLGVG